MLRVIGFLIPLGLDTFAVAAALGMAGIPARQRLRVGIAFPLFEMGMPLVGVAVGRAAAGPLGSVADYLAVAVLLVLGVRMAVSDDDDEADVAARLLSGRGLATIGMAISISLDELAIGLSLGLFGLPIAVVVLLIGVQALLVTQLGLAIGAHVGKRLRETAERLAGGTLVILGLALLWGKLMG
jgi:manganese efflux pump family protein